MVGVLPNLKIASLDLPSPVFIGETTKVVVKVENPSAIPRRATISVADKRPGGVVIKTSFGPVIVRGTMTFTVNLKVEVEGIHEVTAQVICTPFVRAPTVNDTAVKNMQVLRVVQAGGGGGQAGFMGGRPPVQNVQLGIFTNVVDFSMLGAPTAPTLPPAVSNCRSGACQAIQTFPPAEVSTPPMFTVVPTLFGILTPSQQGGGTQ